jgi:membrane-associated phospholipid phosphatase
MAREDDSLHALRGALDAAGLLFVGLLILLAWLFPEGIHRPADTSTDLLIAGVAYIFAVSLTRAIASPPAATAIHATAVLFLYSFLFQTIAGYQHLIIGGWMDEALIAWEESLTGTELSLLMQHIVNPPLTEWMMFTYIIYIPLLPSVAFICYRSAGPPAATQYLLALALAYIMCYVGFVLFPVASPLYHYPERYTVPLEGGFFTWCGEWLREKGHYAGGSLPSPHCAAGTVMMVMLYRYNRGAFALTVPVFVTINVAIVYARYHYLSDGLAGILVAMLALRFGPSIARSWDFLARRVRLVLCGFVAPWSVRVDERREQQ